MSEKGDSKYRLTPKGLNDAQVQKRLDLYSERGEANQYFSIQKIKKRYQEANKEETEKRSKSDLFYAQGIRAGLPHSSFETIKYGREEADQNYRDHIVKEAKSKYRKGENLSKWFNEATRDKREPESNLNKQSKGEPSKGAESRSGAHKKIGGLMAKYDAVNKAKRKSEKELKKLETGQKPSSPTSFSFKKPKIDQAAIEKNAASLTKYFNATNPSKSELKETFKTIKEKGLDKGLSRDI